MAASTQKDYLARDAGPTPQTTKGKYLPEHPIGGLHRMTFVGQCSNCHERFTKDNPGWKYYVKITLRGSCHENVAVLTKLCNDCDPMGFEGLVWDPKREEWKRA